MHLFEERPYAKSDRRILAYALVLFLAAMLQYAYSLKNDFVWDSRIVFVEDPSIREFKFLPRYFTEAYYAHVESGGSQGAYLKYYRPLVKIIHLLEFQAFGTNPIGYNAVSILLNAAVVVLAFLLVGEVTGSWPAAFLAALLFAVNPSRVEAVSWAYSDSYLFAAFLSLLSLLLYRRQRLVLSCASFALSLFCHESAILLPFIVILFEYLIPREPGAKRYVRILPYLAIAGAFLVLRRAVVGPPPLTHLPPLTFANTVAVIIKRFVKITFYPDAPITIYPLETFSRITTEVALSYAVVLTLAVIGVVLWFKERRYLFWYLWFFTWMAVAFNVGPFGDYLMADKLLNLASLGFCTLVALVLIRADMRRTTVAILAALLVIFHSAVTFNRTRYWRNNTAYFEKALEFAPDFYPANYAMGSDYLTQWKPDKAIPLLDKALQLRPGMSVIHNDLGTAYFEKGDFDRALAEWETAVRMDPSNPVPYYAIGAVRERRGQYAAALRCYRQSLALTHDPSPALVEKIRVLAAMTGT